MSGRLLLLGSASLASLCWSAAALAQDRPALPPTEQPAQENAPVAELGDPEAEIVVTGSRVRGVAPVGSTVIALGREELEQSSGVTVDRIIKEIPQNFDLGVSENSRGQAGGSGNIVFGNSVNLRGIGPYATLVLIDGHRVVNNGRATDPSVLPTLGVERVEVVADGASAIYGSDAVAGVVNLIPRRTLNGVEAFARAGIADEGDFTEYALGVAAGKTFSRGQVMVAYEHVDRSALSGDGRDFFTSDQRPFGGNDYRVTRCAPGTLRAGGVSYAMPAVLTPANAASLVPGTVNLCDDAAGQDLFPHQSYDSVNATASFEVTDWLELFADGFYSRREFSRNPSYTSTTLTVPQTNAFFVRPPGFTGTSYTIDYNFMNDLSQNTSSGYAQSWQVTPGLRIRLPYNWEFEGLVGTGETRDNAESRNGLNNAALAAALASSNPATAFDPYGLGRTSDAVLAAISDQVYLTPTNGDLTLYEARLNGPLFALPGGTVKLAAGYERQEFDIALGLGRGNPDTTVTFREFDRSIDSVYAELFVPLFGPANATGGFERLELNAAVRYDSYSDVGGTTNPKFGVSWSPVRGVTVRGSYGTSFRAPTLPEIYGNSNALFGQSYQNPSGGAPLLGFALSGPNLDLNPETAETWSVGADIEPIDRLRLSVTFFNVEYENQVSAYLSNLAILTQESLFAGTGVILRGQDARDAVAAALAEGLPVVARPIPGGDIANVDLFIDGRSKNLGRSITQGIDFSALYSFDLGIDDRLTLNASGTYLTNYEEAITATAPLNDVRNLLFRPLTFKARASATWDSGPFSLRVLATHVGGYENDAVTPSEDVSSFTPVDLSLTWRLGEDGSGWIGRDLTFTLEARNVLDEDPPYVNLAPGGNGSGGYDATASSPVGRLFAASVRTSF
ncbi:TonB-dependent receptor plug domain-containing protein [Sphingosinithalassobacter sp. CS137]|uniref:TonB-dependent receptor plug domain-containing protein n=1 Tax=Sphingosinithalassobacter sp. CS137 TaxID=2762748 RepID=UPI00165DA01A|nr:TonB-dependent receptor [Sphingosinithalassobacter sp. CS137]